MMKWSDIEKGANGLFRIRKKWKIKYTPTRIIGFYLYILLRCAGGEKFVLLLEAFNAWIDTLEWWLPWLLFKFIYFLLVSELPVWVGVCATIGILVWGLVEVVKYLGLKYDKNTKQILTPEVFIEEYAKDSYSTPLDTPFQHREDELSAGISRLKESDVVVFRGPAGVGKTRLSLKVQERFCEENPSFISLCISNKGTDIHQDLRKKIDPKKEYIILLDDVNRMGGHLESVLALLKEERLGKIKLLLTVREYVKETTVAQLSRTNYSEVEITTFTDKQLKDILESEPYELQNPAIITHILKVVQGNARLAIMAATSVQKNKALVFDEVSQIYENYYSELYTQLFDSNDEPSRSALTVIAFLQVTRQESINDDILEPFGLNTEIFWKAMRYFDRMEVVDLYENSVRFSDQTFATYVLYAEIIKHSLLPFESFLSFFPSQNARLKEVVYSIANSFDFAAVKERISDTITEHWSKKKKGEYWSDYVNTFWVFMPYETLEFIEDRISDNVVEPSLQDSELFMKSNTHMSEKLTELDCLVNMVRTYPAEWYARLITVLIKTIGSVANVRDSSDPVVKALTFTTTDHHKDYLRQRTYIKACIDTYREHPTKVLYQHIVLLCKYFLNIEFEYSPGLDRNNMYTIQPLCILEKSGGRELRNLLITWIIENVKEHTVLQHLALAYAHQNTHKVSKEVTDLVVQNDSLFLLPFLSECLDPTVFGDQFVMMRVLSFLKRSTSNNYEAIENIYQTNDYLLYTITDPFELANGGVRRSYKNKNTFEAKKSQEIISHYDQTGEAEIIKGLRNILSIPFTNRSAYKIGIYLTTLTKILNESGRKQEALQLFELIVDNDLLIKTIAHHSSFMVYQLLTNSHDHERVYKLLEPLPQQWKQDFFGSLDDELLPTYKEEILNFYSTLSQPITIRSLSHVFALGNDTSLEILNAVVEQSKEEDVLIRFSYDCFEEDFDRLRDQPSVLIYVYESQQNEPGFKDFDGAKLEKLLAISPEYVCKLLKAYIDIPLFQHNEFPNHAFCFLWDTDAGRSCIESTMELAKQKKIYDLTGSHPLGQLFKTDEAGTKNQRYELLKQFLISNKDSHNAVLLACAIVTNAFSSKALAFYAYAIQQAPGHSIITYMRPKSSSWVGSRVPQIEYEIQQYERLRRLLSKLPKTKPYGKHIQEINDEIRRLRSETKREKRIDFEEV